MITVIFDTQKDEKTQESQLKKILGKLGTATRKRDFVYSIELKKDSSKEVIVDKLAKNSSFGCIY